MRLSEANFSGRSLTAVAIAAHEVGHAMQDHQKDPRLVIRTKLVPIADKVARFSAGAIWAAPIFALDNPSSGTVLGARRPAVLGALIRMMVHLVTLPIEWDASFGKALPVLKGRFLSRCAKQEQVVAKILRAAAFTYVAAALADVLNLTRWAAHRFCAAKSGHQKFNLSLFIAKSCRWSV